MVPSRLRPGPVRPAAEPAALQADPDDAGCGCHIQLPKCLRDEDPRADRQAEFTQIDLEMSFVDRDDVLETMGSFARPSEGDARRRRRRDSVDDLAERYGIDRPDLRFGLEISDISDLAAKTDFGVRVGPRRAPWVPAW